MFDKITSLLGAICVLVLMVVWGAFWVGLGLSATWNWFIAPKFILPTLGILEAYGVALVVATLRTQKIETDGAKRFAERLVLAPIAAGLILATGWIVKLWI